MKVQMLKAMAGMEVSYRKDQIIETTAVIGKAWIEAGIAKAPPKKASKNKSASKKG